MIGVDFEYLQRMVQGRYSFLGPLSRVGSAVDGRSFSRFSARRRFACPHLRGFLQSIDRQARQASADSILASNASLLLGGRRAASNMRSLERLHWMAANSITCVVCTGTVKAERSALVALAVRLRPSLDAVSG